MHQNALNTRSAFAGFQRKPDGNFAFTMVPNQFLDEIVPHEKPCVIKVVCLILRRTIGWLDERGQRRTQEQVAYSEFVREMNMSTQAVADGLKIALEKGYIVRVKPGSSYNPHGTGEGAWYSLRWQDLPAHQNTPTIEEKADSIDQSQMTLEIRDMRNKTESENKEINLELNSTNNQIQTKPVKHGKFSTYIGNVITEIGEQFGDDKHRLSNIKHALNLWDKPQLSEADFVKLLYQARDLTRQHTSAVEKAEPKPKRFAGWLGSSDKSEKSEPAAQRNRMPYFFRVLEELLKTPSSSDVRDNSVQENDLRAEPDPANSLPIVEDCPANEPTQPTDVGHCSANGLTESVQHWAERWSTSPQQTLSDWQTFLTALPQSPLRASLTKALGLEARQAVPSLLTSLGLAPQTGQVDILLLVENAFEVRYLAQHLGELGQLAQNYWEGSVTFHFLCP